jgi:hypothetical protein
MGGGQDVEVTTRGARVVAAIDGGVEAGAGVGTKVGVWISAGCGVGVGMGIGVNELGAAGCVCGTGVTGAFDGPTSFSMAVAHVIGDVVCMVSVGAAVEAGTMRAVVLNIASGDGFGCGGGFSP